MKTLSTRYARWIGALVFSAMALTQVAHADTMAPDALVKKLTEDVMATIKSDKDIQAGNVQKINGLVETQILPYVDFQKMTAKAVGVNWSKASPDQQKQITEQFRTLLVYTYSGALSQVRNQTIQFSPFRADPADKVVEVKTKVSSSNGGEPIQLNYKLENQNGEWKIIDVNVLGAWLVQTYQTSFTQEVSRGGIDGLIKTLTDKNKAAAAQKGAV